MQQYIVIPELCAIIRKIAPEGNHIARFGAAALAERVRSLLEVGLRREDGYWWSFPATGAAEVRSKENT
jgi:hypothetical protein